VLIEADINGLVDEPRTSLVPVTPLRQAADPAAPWWRPLERFTYMFLTCPGRKAAWPPGDVAALWKRSEQPAPVCHSVSPLEPGLPDATRRPDLIRE
jgi:hypothetical protein